MKSSERHEVLTVDGKASIVVQDADTYQGVIELAERMDSLLAVEESLDSMRRDDD